MLRIGIVGMGGIGWFHAARYYQIPGATLVAIADIRPDRLEAKLPIAINIENKVAPPDLSTVDRYPDARQLIAKADVDVIDVCLPSYLHAEYVIEALQAGRHVLCEKPMALSINDADRMVESSQKSGKKLMIAHCIRFWPEYLYLKGVLSQGIYGRLLSLNMFRIGGKPDGWGWDNWFINPALSGGSLFDLHVHDVDFVNSLLGVPSRIMASSRKAEPESGCDIIHSIFQYDNGPQVSIHAGWSEVQIPFKAAFEAWFERGFIRYDPDKSPTLVEYTDAHKADGLAADFKAGDAYLAEINYFLDCVNNNLDVIECSPESTRDSITLLSKELTAMRGEEK